MYEGGPTFTPNAVIIEKDHPSVVHIRQVTQLDEPVVRNILRSCFVEYQVRQGRAPLPCEVDLIWNELITGLAAGPNRFFVGEHNGGVCATLGHLRELSQPVKSDIQKYRTENPVLDSLLQEGQIREIVEIDNLFIDQSLPKILRRKIAHDMFRSVADILAAEHDIGIFGSRANLWPGANTLYSKHPHMINIMANEAYSTYLFGLNQKGIAAIGSFRKNEELDARGMYAYACI